ncbi:MAG: hypothetical protein R3212_06560 [Xanthomonadales bacterium]|nr:hypothetical protein [Xanthomonadales bacterium]
MKLNIKLVTAYVLIALLLSACGLFKKKDPEYYNVAEAQPLTVPDGLDSPVASTALTIETPTMPLPQRELNDVPPRVLANQNTRNANTSLHWSAEGVYILVKDSTDSVQRRLGYVIERSGMAMQGRGPDGNYRFEYHHVRPENEEGFFGKLAFWRDDPPDYSGTYETLLRPDSQGTRVFVQYPDGGEVPMEAAEQVLVILKERLG